MTNAYVQRNQPPGVPALALTGERTLPDVPEENYWYQRHLIVYKWIAGLVEGMRVVDMACGEGYGAATLAAAAASVVGVDANPEAHEHARLRYQRENLIYERSLVETYGAPGAFDAVTFLQTIEHVRNPVEVLTHFKSLLSADGIAFISTPNLLTLAPAGAEKSENPWHIKEYVAQDFRDLCEEVFDHVQIYGLYHAGKLRTHEVALKLGWDHVHKGLRISKPFYDRFTPAISVRDFTLAADRPLYAALDFVAVCS